MSRFGLVGPSYASQSPLLDAEECINLYVEQAESGAGNAPLAMYSTPGLKSFVDLTPAPVNGIGAFDKQGSSFGTGTAIATPTLTPAVVNEWAFMSVGAPANGATPAAGWAVLDASFNFDEFFLGAGNITGNATLGASQNWISALLLFKMVGLVAPNLVQKGGQSGAFVPPYNPAFGVNTQPGSTIIFTNYVAALNSGDLTPTLTDSQGNVYTHTTHQLGTVGELDVWVAQNTLGGPLVFTLNSPRTGTTRTSNFYEFSLGVPSPFSFTRGSITVVGRTFFVCGANFCEVLANGTSIVWGAVANDGQPVTMAASPQQLLLASAGTAYVFDLMANTLVAIPGATFAGPVSEAAICDGFFILTIQNSKQFVVSAPLNALDWVTNGAAIVSVFPDNIVSMLVFQRQIWFFSDAQSVVYYDSGNIFPFDVNPNAFIEAGSAAQNSPAIFNNSIAWLGADSRGNGKVWLANGYTPTRISNHAVEFAIQSYTKISDAVAFSYQDQGHEFYALYFPTPSVMWLYDAMTGMWHKRGFWLQNVGQYRAAHYWNHTFNFGKHLVGDWQSGKVYQMSIPVSNGAGGWNFADDDGNPIRRVRRAPHVSKEQKKQFHTELQVYLETGLGPIPPLSNNPLLTATDNFNRANENPLVNPPWSTIAGVNGLQVVGNVAVPTPTGAANIFSFSRYSAGTNLPSDQSSSAAITAGVAFSGNLAVMCRVDALGNGYVGWVDFTNGAPSHVGPGSSCELVLSTMKNGLWGGANPTPVFGLIGNMSPVLAGDVLAIQAVGNKISLLYNGVVVLSVTDSTFVGGNPGIGIFRAGAFNAPNIQWDNWSGTSVQTFRDPMISLRWSDDGGHNWSNELIRDCGRAGEFKKRVRWLQLGSSRDRVYEISMSDPIPWRVIDGYLQIVQGTGI